MKSTSSVSLYGRYIVSGTVSSAWMHVAVQNNTSSNLHPFILSLQTKNRSIFYFQDKKRCKNVDILYPDLHVPECEYWRTVVTWPLATSPGPTSVTIRWRHYILPRTTQHLPNHQPRYTITPTPGNTFLHACSGAKYIARYSISVYIR